MFRADRADLGRGGLSERPVPGEAGTAELSPPALRYFVLGDARLDAGRASYIEQFTFVTEQPVDAGPIVQAADRAAPAQTASRFCVGQDHGIRGATARRAEPAGGIADAVAVHDASSGDDGVGKHDVPCGREASLAMDREHETGAGLVRGKAPVMDELIQGFRGRRDQ